MLSGLYGVIRPLELIQPYRLEIGARLENNTKGKSLYEFWSGEISTILNENETDIIINLTSNEYSKGIDQRALNAKIISVVFKEFKNNAYKIIWYLC